MSVYGPAWAEVELSSIEYNTNQVIRFVKSKKKDTKVLAVVKADAYGHGAIEVSKIMIDSGIDYLGVATVFEALELREAGIMAPILIFGYTPIDFVSRAIEEDISITVSSFDYAKELEAISRKIGRVAKVHIKIDVGMTRLGMPCSRNSIYEITSIKNLDIYVEGIFGHFPLADSSDDSITLKQGYAFEDLLVELESRGVTFDIRHICNSAAAMRHSQFYFDMVRMGGILYGHNCLINQQIESIIAIKEPLSIRSLVANIIDVEANTGVSYGWMYTTEKSSKIGALAIGYTDGIDRRNTNVAEFLIKGKRVKQVGLICMDQMMVDLSDMEGVKTGDVVTLLGSDKDDVITLGERTKSAGISKCEFFTSIGHRLPKVYFYNGKYMKTINYLINK